MKVAYLVNQYPKVSHTFIRREIHAVELHGIDIERIAIRGWDQPTPDAQDAAEKARTRYVLKGGVRGLLAAMCRVSVDAPWRALKALWLAIRMGIRSDRSLPLHLVYFAEACQVALWLRESGAGHVHAHFGTNAAEVAMLVDVLGGPGYSFTVHGPEEFDKPEFLHLGEKMRRARFIVAISAFCRSQLYRWVEAEHWSKIKEIHCGIERTFYASDDVGEIGPPTAKRLICVGRLSAQKGHLLLIDAAAIAMRRGADFELVLAGDGELRGVVEQRIRDLDLQQRVRITGWIASDQVRAEIIAARALILASFAEGLPVVLMEAMALRRPVLSTLIAGVPELVRHGESGWLYPAGDVEAMAQAILDCLATSPERMAQMGEVAHLDVVKRHDIDIDGGKLAVLFRQTAHD